MGYEKSGFNNPFKENNGTDIEEELLETKKSWEVAFDKGVEMANNEDGCVTEQDWEDYD